MKKLSIVFLLMLLSIILIGCGETEPSTSDKDNSTEKESDVKEDFRQYSALAFEENVPYLTDEALVANPATIDYIKKNTKLFPALSDEEINHAKELAEPVEYKLLMKNTDPFAEQLLSFEGEVIQINEERMDDDIIFSWLFIYVEEVDNSFSVFMYKDTGDIVEGDNVKVYGVPAGVYSIDVSDGGFVNSPLFFGSHVDKQ